MIWNLPPKIILPINYLGIFLQFYSTFIIDGFSLLGITQATGFDVMKKLGF
jgi:hypothetical protein